MRYFINFKNGKVDCYWKREDENNHPDYIKENIFEISKEQYDLQRFLTLENNVVVWKQPCYQLYLDTIADQAADEVEKDQLKAGWNIIKNWNSVEDIDMVIFKKFVKVTLKHIAGL